MTIVIPFCKLSFLNCKNVLNNVMKNQYSVYTRIGPVSMLA